MSSRRGILFAAAGLSIAAAGFVVIVHQNGVRRLADATERFESEIGTLAAGAHAPPAPADDENAALWLQRGTAALALSEADRAALADFWQREREPPGPAVLDLLERNAPALEQLRRAGELELSSWGIVYDAGPHPPLPDLMEPLLARQILFADARAGLAGNDRQRVLEAAGALAALRRALEREPLLVFQLLAMAVENSHHQLVHDLLNSSLVDEALLEELTGQLGSKSESRLRSAFAVEASWMLASVDLVPETPGAWWQRLLQAPARLWAPYESAAALDGYYALAKATKSAAGQEGDPLGSSPPTFQTTGVIAPILVPNLIDGLKKHRAAAAGRQLARLAISLRLRALREGTYPRTLADFPGAGGSDPYAGSALHYERRDDGSAVISFADAESRWQRENAHLATHRPRFVWRLPGN